MPADPHPSPELFSLLKNEIDEKLDASLAGIVRESFASEQRVHDSVGWDSMTPTMLQYLRDDTAPSGVLVKPIALPEVSDARQVLDLLIGVIDGSDARFAGSGLREKLLTSGSREYLGCSVAFECYMFLGTDKERSRYSPGIALADMAESVEMRCLRGATTQGRRFQVVRARDTDPFAIIDAPPGKDPTRPSTAINMAVDRMNAVLRNAYAN